MCRVRVTTDSALECYLLDYNQTWINLGYCFLNAHGTFLKHILYGEGGVSNIVHAMSNTTLQQFLATTQETGYEKSRGSSKPDSSATLSYKGGTVPQLKRQSPETEGTFKVDTWILLNSQCLGTVLSLALSFLMLTPLKAMRVRSWRSWSWALYGEFYGSHTG